VLLAQSRERYLRSPRLVAEGEGARLYAIAWERDGEAIVSCAVSPEAEVGELAVDARAERIAALDHGTPPRATSDPDDEDRASAGAYRAEVRRDGYRSRVVVTLPSGDEVVVFDAWGTASAPALALARDGVWIAFHHNVREDTSEPDLAKWIAVRFVDASGRVMAPAAPMTDRDRDREGEEQSFEFPTLVAGDDGAIAIFGRGSHRFYRQDLSRAGFSPREGLDEGAWGCRGRRVAAVRVADGAVLTARRERGGIVVARVAAPEGLAPELVPATVETLGKPPATTAADRRDPAARDGRRTLFGDIHQHSAHSDGIGTAHEPYLRARHLYGDDFCALSDHESFLGKRIGPGEWEYLQSVADRHDEPGRFATLLAYEWTAKMFPGPGHKVVYPSERGSRVLSRDDLPEGADVVGAARAAGAFVVPHHVGWTGANEEAHDPSVQPVWEICSCHGCYEHFAHELGQRGDLRDQMVDAVLRRGRRFGFIASSDGHGLLYHHGVARKRDPFRTGLAAVQAKDKTRDAILTALRERRCYATSGAKILLDLRAGDTPMGGELGARGPVRVTGEAEGTAPLERLELVGPDGVIESVPGGTERAQIVHDVDAPYVYLRVKQRDGEMAWSSPIWSSR
jgi:hypothetical protein